MNEFPLPFRTAHIEQIITC